jgi:hypothetical protein
MFPFLGTNLSGWGGCVFALAQTKELFIEHIRG